ncbi:MAG: hypothetical protein J5586_00660 [Clostridia bacterium]|nr:hypothetical protein [Clostridia bacterium]
MKKTTALLLAALMLLSAVSCTDGNKPAPTEAPKNTEAPAYTQEAGNTADPEATLTPAEIQFAGDLSYDPETDYDPRFGSFMDIVIDAGDVFYLHPDSSYICYADKSGGDWGVLCGRPDCEHGRGNINEQNDDCNGCLGSDIGAMVWKYGDKLYYVDDWAGVHGESCGALYRMNLDGSGHEKVCMLPEIYGSFDEAMWPQCFYCHRGLIYTRTLYYDVENAEPIKRTGYYAMNMDGSDVRIIYESDKSGYGYMTFMGEYCYVLDYFNEFDEEGEVKNSIVTMLRWSPNTEKAEVLYEGNDIQLPNIGDLFMKDGEIYIASKFDKYTGQNGVMRFKDGGWEEMINFDDPETNWSVFCVSDGIAIARRHIRYDPDNTAPYWEAQRSTDLDIWIKDFEGNTLYKGKLPVGWTELLDNGLFIYNWEKTAFGDRNTVYFMLDVGLQAPGHEDYTKEKNILLRYDITENGLEETLLSEITGWPMGDEEDSYWRSRS